MLSFNWVDYVILAVFFLSILGGFYRGFVREFVSLVVIVIAFFVAAKFASPLAESFTRSMAVQHTVNQASSVIGANTAQPVSYAALGISFVVLFVGVVIIGAIINFLLNLIFSAGIVGFGNRLLGGIFGACRAFIIILVVMFLVQLSSFASEPAWRDSTLVQAFQPTLSWVSSRISPTLSKLKEKLNSTLSNSSPGQSSTKKQ